ncbi:MAG: type II secretion system minor pseudopilin GspH [Kangiellaceae bacterium]|jgi:general secretion pathway protein H|nr:type II secretion system minor pseudopilin GspH [Kangiellaceae bacterium]
MYSGCRSQLFSKSKSLRKDYAGFSLIELMIALVVVAVIVAMASLTLTDKRQQELNIQAKRLYALLKQAQDETVLRGVDIGLRVERDKYLFYLYDTNTERWLPITDDELFTERAIPEILDIKLSVDGNSLFSTDTEEDIDIFEEDVDIFEDEEQKIEPPQIYILSSGEMSSFKIAIGWIGDTNEDSRYYLLEGTLLGDISMTGPMDGDLRDEVYDDAILSL